MAKEAMKSRVRISLNEAGEIVLWVGELSESLSEGGVDNLINMLNTAKADSKEVSAAIRKIKAVTKGYNSIGKQLDDCNVKAVDGGGICDPNVITE